MLCHAVLCAVQGALAQHETYAKLEAQGAQQVELEMRRLRLQVKDNASEAQRLQPQGGTMWLFQLAGGQRL